MKFNKIVYCVGLLMLANYFVTEAAEVDFLEAQKSLHMALSHGPKGCVEGVSEALNNGADPNKSLRNRLPLVFAAKDGKEEIVRVLLEHNANANKRNIRGCAPLYAAANRECSYLASEGIKQQEAIMQLLLEYDASANGHNFYGPRPLHAVITRWGSKGLGAVQLLLAAGADVNASYSTDSVARWPFLTQEEVDESVQNMGCVTPLSLAAQRRYGNIARVLLGAGADQSLIPSTTTRAFVKKVENDARKAVATLLVLGSRRDGPMISSNKTFPPYFLLNKIGAMATDGLSERLRREYLQNKS